MLFFFITSLNFCFGQEQWIKIDLEETVYLNKRTCLKKTGEPLNENYAIKFNRYQTNYEPFIDGLKNGEVKKDKRLVAAIYDYSTQKVSFAMAEMGLKYSFEKFLPKEIVEEMKSQL